MIKTACCAIAGAALLAACAGQDGQDPGGGGETIARSTSSLEPGTQQPGIAESIYVTVQAEFDRCSPIAFSGLAWIREVNEHRRPMLVALDESGLTRTAVEQTAGAPEGALVLRGVLGGDDADGTRLRTFTALEAWRGMPDVEAGAESAYVRVEMHEGNIVAAFLNGDRRHEVRSVSVDHAALPFVDRDWLASRVMSHYGLLAGVFDRDVVEVTQVFVHLPDVPGPCPELRIRCEPGTVPTYERDANRCLIPAGCVQRGRCPMYIPSCQAGYDLQRWPSRPSACDAFACDPSFVDVH